MIKIKNISMGNGLPFVLFAGPCVVENEEITFKTAEEIKKISSQLNIPFVFKSSYKKANRTSLQSFSGLDQKESLGILQKVKQQLELPIITDVHTKEEVAAASEVADVLQIPAFLCRQTDLLLAAGKTGKVINVKKGQFLAPHDVKHIAEKIESTSNKNIIFTERGTSFGYHNLVVDMRGLEIMKEFGYPVIMDATHSVQIPGQGGVSRGERKYISTLAKAAAAVGIDGLFLEVHPEPDKALSDAESQLPLSDLFSLLVQIKKIDILVKNEN